MRNMKMHFNYVGIKGDSGKSLPLTGLDTVREHNVRDFREEDPNFVLCREDQLIITLIKLRHNHTVELLAHIVNPLNVSVALI